MKLLSVFVCATTLVCVIASPLSNAANLPRAAGCTFNPSCDSTGEEKIPIPCEGYCDSYFFCQNGRFTVEKCPSNLFSQQRFNIHLRRCDSGFTDCDWWRSNQTTTGNPDASNPTLSPDPSNPTNNPSSTTTSTSSPTAATTEPTTIGPCHWRANCDPTGTEKKPIPCPGFCRNYYLCNEGQFTVETCPTLRNFDYVTRECSFSFNNCDWYLSLPTDPPTEPSTPTPTATFIPSRPSSTSSAIVSPSTEIPCGNRAGSIVHSTFSLFMTVLIPLLSRYL